MTTKKPDSQPEPEPDKFQVSAEHVLTLMQQLYPTEFAHVVAVVEAQYWKDKATSGD